MDTIKRTVTVERLANGFLRVYDYSCQWASLYNADGSYRHGQADLPAYRAAVQAFLAKPAPRLHPVFQTIVDGLIFPQRLTCHHPSLQINEDGICCDCGTKVSA